MTTPEIAKVKKRDGSIADFEQERITKAIYKALTVADEGDEKTAEKVSDRVVKVINRRFSKREIPEVEQIQDIVEEVLMLEDLIQTAKNYIIYREQRRRMRETETIYDEAVEIYDKYINEIDWQVKENANMSYSLQGLNNYGVATLTKRYWLNKIYPQQIREAAASGDFHIHDLDFLGAYCCGWDLYDLLKRGFGGVAGKVESKPPK
ncbi:MAG: anaerobic ribonucleoside-triphosphate reductase, partial [Patescibacteria group bacterium]